MIDADNDGHEEPLCLTIRLQRIPARSVRGIKVLQYYHNIGIDSLEKFHYLVTLS